MKLFPDATTFISFGSLSVKWYAVLILTGASIAYYFCVKNIKSVKHISVDLFSDLFVYTLWVGIIGSRLWFCVFYDLSYYLEDPVRFIRVWDGGLAIQGALVAGVAFAYFYSKKHSINFFILLDCVMPNVLFAQAMGRWGNFVNRECYGPVVEESYFDGLLSFIKDGMYIGGSYRMPMFFYESCACFAGWLIINFVLRKYQNKRGDLAYSYMMWYGVARFFIEAKRTDSLYIGKLKMAMVTSVVFVVIGLLGYFGLLDKLFKKKKPTILFDMDGTLVNTTASIIEAYSEVFRQFDKIENFTEERKVEVLGPALKDIFPKYFPGYDYDTLYAVYSARQKQVSKQLNELTPNSELVLKTLHEQGYHIGIVSTRSLQGIKDLLADFDLSDTVEDIMGLKEVENLKPNPEAIYKIIAKNNWNPDDVIMIGDSNMDILCGKNYGAFTVGFDSHNDKRQQLEDAKPNEIIDDMISILDIVNEKHYFTYNLK